MEQPCLTHNMNNRGKSDSGGLRYRKTRRYGGGRVCSLPVGHCSTGIRRQPRHRTRHIAWGTSGLYGNENTFALYDTQETASPMAEAVFDLWRYGQSAYVPSVAEMRLLYTMRKIINPVIEQCGGEPLPLDENDCWYWDIHRSRKATDSQGMALFHGERCNAGNT